MGYREKYKKANPEFERINKIIPMDIHHKKQRCDGGNDELDNLEPMLKGRHEKHKHNRKGKDRELDYEDYLYE